MHLADVVEDRPRGNFAVGRAQRGHVAISVSARGRRAIVYVLEAWWHRGMLFAFLRQRCPSPCSRRVRPSAVPLLEVLRLRRQLVRQRQAHTSVPH